MTLWAVHDCRWKLLGARPRVASPTVVVGFGKHSYSRADCHPSASFGASYSESLCGRPLVAFPDNAATTIAAVLSSWGLIDLCGLG